MRKLTVFHTRRTRAVATTRLTTVLGLALLCACSDSLPSNPEIQPPHASDPQLLPAYFPPVDGSANWDTISPARLGYDATALRNAIDWAGQQQSTAVIVLWRGRIVAERYWNGWTIDKDSIIASAGKSVVSALAGEFVRRGTLGADSTVSRYLGAGWSRSPSTEPRITVRHILGMMSGLDDSLKRVVEPGTRFYYNGAAYYQSFAMLQAVSGRTINTMSREMLFDRIGMPRASWRFNISFGEPGWVLSCTPREMARFGLLALNRGRWNGETILADSAWYTAAWRQAPPDNAGYGLLWWLNGSNTFRLPGPYQLPSVQGSLVPSAPRDLVAALGKGDKKIYVVPSLELVVIRHGPEADAGTGNPLALSQFDEQWWQRLKLAFRY